MKIRVEIDSEAQEDEILIRCREINSDITQIQCAIGQVINKKQRFQFFKEEKEYFFELDNILFFETDENGICAHTVNDIYSVKYRLYELEEMLPRSFVRVSKSTILNVNKIYSMERNITSYSTVSFRNTHKQVYVSRRYLSALKLSLEEKR